MRGQQLGQVVFGGLADRQAVASRCGLLGTCATVFHTVFQNVFHRQRLKLYRFLQASYKSLKNLASFEPEIDGTILSWAPKRGSDQANVTS